MAIEVRHGTSAAATAAAALGGAQAKSRSRAALGGARAATQIELANQRIAAQSKLTQEGRQFAAGQAQLGHERGLERQQVAAGLNQEAAVAAQGRRRSDIEFGLTAKQEANQERLSNALADLLANKNFSAEEKAQGAQQIREEMAGIELVPKVRTPSVGEQFENEVHTTKTGERVFRDKRTGAWKALPDQAAERRQQEAELENTRWKLAIEQAKGEHYVDDAGKKHGRTAEEIMKGRGLSRPGGGAPQQGQQAAPDRSLLEHRARVIGIPENEIPKFIDLEMAKQQRAAQGSPGPGGAGAGGVGGQGGQAGQPPFAAPAAPSPEQAALAAQFPTQARGQAAAAAALGPAQGAAAAQLADRNADREAARDQIGPAETQIKRGLFVEQLQERLTASTNQAERLELARLIAKTEGEMAAEGTRLSREGAPEAPEAAPQDQPAPDRAEAPVAQPPAPDRSGIDAVRVHEQVDGRRQVTQQIRDRFPEWPNVDPESIASISIAEGLVEDLEDELKKHKDAGARAAEKRKARSKRRPEAAGIRPDFDQQRQLAREQKTEHRLKAARKRRDLIRSNRGQKARKGRISAENKRFAEGIAARKAES